MPRGVYKRNVAAKKPIEPMEMDTDKLPDITLPADGPVNRETTVIERTADILNADKKAEAAAFNEEKVVVMMHESADPNAEKILTFGINGRMVYLERGVQYSISRKYVERMARSKIHGVRTVEDRDKNGVRTTRIERTSALAYPFSVIEDKNPLGRQWLQNLLQQP